MRFIPVRKQSRKWNYQGSLERRQWEPFCISLPYAIFTRFCSAISIPFDFKFADAVRHVTVTSGSSLSIKCNLDVVSWAVVDVRWLLGNVELPIQRGNRLEYSATSPGYTLLDNGVLLIDHMTVENADGHLYRCKGSSPTGKQVLSAEESVQVHVISYSGERKALQWLVEVQLHCKP